MAVAGNQSDFENIEFDLQGAIQLHCSFEKNYNDDICLVHRLSPEVTYDDVDYIVNKSHYSLSLNITGKIELHSYNTIHKIYASA